MKGVLLLILTIFSGVLAREGYGPYDQEWGYVTVREQAHIFWWLYFTNATQNPYDRPLAIWLQGGPGASSVGYGNFEEIGPLDQSLNPRNYSWVKDLNLMFVDNPVGTGFSYVDDIQALATTNNQIALDFVELLKGFYKALPQFEPVPLYIFCESYGGKMTAEIALELNKAIKRGEIKSNLTGIALGDSWVDPYSSVESWSEYLFNVGAIDSNGVEALQQTTRKLKVAIDEERWVDATDIWGIAEDDIYDYTDGIDFYNILTEIDDYYLQDLKKQNSLKRIAKRELREVVPLSIIMNDVKKALNLTSTWGQYAGWVFDFLTEDFMKPVNDVVERLLNETSISVNVLSGQLDLIVATPGTVKWVENLRWKNASEYLKAPRRGFSVNGIYEGYEKSYGTLTFYWVLRAGHMVPADNPKGMEYILKKVTNNYSV
ncbi:retinoid-inducible serine carboxypeptidase-like [Cylas formicarius]|uniref:retinoid-inducible serine carboxypeptidase-like n=1 Tax=Cylas formicarius TaxID=197179 RepID=UPI002958C27C|nr:retinoid-inducible serine carboxypeptidase-like [Cylas formicarius]